MGKIRGADIVARVLDGAGLRTVFALSGNHIMPIFDAAIGTGLKLIHVRHEAATVHMADAWARLTGDCGIALVTGGPGHANAVGALYTAQAAESPLVLLSGHAATHELGRGAFQELRQADMAEPAVKASWVASSIAGLGSELARAIRIAKSGRPGPVHLSLPFDVLEATTEDAASFQSHLTLLAEEMRTPAAAAIDSVVSALSKAERPSILAGPMLCTSAGRTVLRDLASATGIPAIGMESPRGINDPSLGAFAEVLRRADLILLLGKPLDFTLRFADPPFVDANCRFVVVDPDPRLIDRVAREKGSRLLASALADPPAVARQLIRSAEKSPKREAAWLREVEAAIAFRPSSWSTLASAPGQKIHPVELCRAIGARIAHDPQAILVCDGGEIGQWPQSVLSPARRIINGVAGSIGAAIPFSIAARLAEPNAPVIAVMGDGTFGFHMAEFDTAVRYNHTVRRRSWQRRNLERGVPNPASRIRRRRAQGCELLPSRYDLVATALGGHGEFVTRSEDLEPALKRAIASGKPACVNVMTERVPAPVLRRQA